MSDALPPGWAETHLGKIRVDRSMSIDPSKHKTETFELYSIPAYPSKRPEIVAGSKVGSTKKSLDPGTVVVSKINPRINRVWVVGDRSTHKQIGSSEWVSFFPLDGIAPKYLAYYLQQDGFRNYLAANVSGVGGSLMRVKPSTVDQYPFVVPPRGEQDRIVSAIESYFTRLDDAVATLERVQRNLKRYRASVLKAAVEGRLVPTEAELACAEGRSYEPASVLLTRILTERRRLWEEAELAKMTAKGKAPKDDRWKAKYVEPVAPDTSALPELPEGWCWTSADAICADVVSGSTPVASKLFAGVGDIPFIKVYNLTMTGELDFTVKPTFISRATHNGQLARSRVRPGDVLTNIVGPPLGKVAVIPGDYDEWNINQAIAAFRPSGGISTEWLRLLLMSEPIQRWLLGTSKTTTSQVNLAVTACRRLPVPLPPGKELVRIAVEAARLLSIAAATNAGVHRDVLRVRRLRQSILNWAFEGRLVDQDPTDEPASVLLERIRAERASATDTTPRRARRVKAKAPKS